MGYSLIHIYITIVITLLLSSDIVLAIPPDTCNIQRAEYLTLWYDTSRDQKFMRCYGHYVSPVFHSSKADKYGNRNISLSLGIKKDKKVFRIRLANKQYKILTSGKEISLMFHSEKSCFIRGHTNDIAYIKMGLSGGFLILNGNHNLLYTCELFH